jgi:hypothetical protein
LLNPKFKERISNTGQWGGGGRGGPMARHCSHVERHARPGSVVGIATAYGLDGPGIESRWGGDVPHLSRPALRPTQLPVNWVPGFSRE